MSWSPQHWKFRRCSWKECSIISCRLTFPWKVGPDDLLKVRSSSGCSMILWLFVWLNCTRTLYSNEGQSFFLFCLSCAFLSRDCLNMDQHYCSSYPWSQCATHGEPRRTVVSFRVEVDIHASFWISSLAWVVLRVGLVHCPVISLHFLAISSFEMTTVPFYINESVKWRKVEINFRTR